MTDSAKLQLDLVTRHAESGWAGFRSTLLGAARALSAEVAADRLTYYEAEIALYVAIRAAGHVPNADDREWVRQGLHDGTRGPVDPREDLGKLAHQWCREHNPGQYRLLWGELSSEDREIFIGMGSALYDAGFQAGADSVGVHA